jgi:hypothetical protein
MHDDVRFSTYQVNTGGERVFDRAGFDDGDRVSEETFFALLLDGDLYNNARPHGIAFSSVRNRVLASMDYAVQTNHLDEVIINGEAYLWDILETLRPRFKDAFDALSAASWLWIYRYWKVHAAQKQP